MTIAIIISAFIIGFLLGDRRGVRQANEILDENMRVIVAAMSEAAGHQEVVKDEPERPTVH